MYVNRNDLSWMKPFYGVNSDDWNFTVSIGLLFELYTPLHHKQITLINSIYIYIYLVTGNTADLLYRIEFSGLLNCPLLIKQ